MSGGPAEPALLELRARLEQEEQAYAEVLAALDALSAFRLPAEACPEAREKLALLNELWRPPERPRGSGLAGALARRVFDVLAPVVERQTAFDAALVQLLNGRLEAADRLHAQLRELSSALVRYAQRVQPLVDAGARLATALATTRSELILESFGRQLESHARRLDGVAALEHRLAAVESRLASLPAAQAPATERER